MNSEWIVSTKGPHLASRRPLLDTAGSRSLESVATQLGHPGFLMQRAGLALAQLSLAVAPHARVFWVACGRGSNGGDGLEAAIHLSRWGKTVHVSMPNGEKPLPAEAALALARGRHAGLLIHDHPPDEWDACIDALLGIGLLGAPSGISVEWINRMNAHTGDILCADIPSGLMADTGATPGACARATHTLAMMSLKPGLFTLQGRDVCGNIWLNTLGDFPSSEPQAWLNPAPVPHQRKHASHKGIYGDVAVVGGTAGMQGAAVLAAGAALLSGAGRVYLTLLHTVHNQHHTPLPPDLMLRDLNALDPARLTVVAGCGGGEQIFDVLPNLLSKAARLVLDADGINAVATSKDLKATLRLRPAGSTVLTPHPLEAARLLNCSAEDVQANRIHAAQRVADQYQCVVILKGSGSVIAAPHATPHINPTGNGKLAIAGTGDVLAGMTGAAWGRNIGAWAAACEACYLHGRLADQWPIEESLTASRLLDCL